MAATSKQQRHQENIKMSAFPVRGKTVTQEGLTRHVPSDGRKTLQTLQYSAVKDRKNLSKDAQLNSQKEKCGKETLQIFADPQPQTPKEKSFDDKAVQTEKKSHGNEKCDSDEGIDQEAYDLMVNEDIPENYWQDMAERRREALDESLHENEKLHGEIDELREENETLSKMASQADYFAGVIQELVGVGQDDKDEETEDKCDDKSEDRSAEEEEEGHKCDEPLHDSEHSDAQDTKSEETDSDENSHVKVEECSTHKEEGEQS